MDNNNCHDPRMNDHHYSWGSSCISWSAILVGAAFIIGLSFLMNLFSASIGLSAFHLSADGAKTLAVGGFLGLLFAVIVVMFFSGWVSGYLGRNRCVAGCCGGIYGFSAWAVALIVTILLSVHVGKFVSSVSDFVATPTYSNVAATTNDAAPVVSTSNTRPAQAVVNTDKVAMGAFALFILFLVGALSATLGGHYGLRRCYKKGNCHDSMNNPEKP